MKETIKGERMEKFTQASQSIGPNLSNEDASKLWVETVETNGKFIPNTSSGKQTCNDSAYGKEDDEDYGDDDGGGGGELVGFF
ncbi:hypothetical protein CDL15_Pgr029025 [Punica granatum]|uniref:Uncharacterized protein n=1 Tax=Punica granatum TaxID=22663 RepID=A0A218XMT6_PUNGR|nr:hypothetical protein CDL15_Pgr029025 [Punica granatum]